MSGRHIGYNPSPFDRAFFSPQNVKGVSARITERLSEGKAAPVVVTDRVITHVMEQVQYHYRPQLSDPYSRFLHRQSDAETRGPDLLNLLNGRVVETVCGQIEAEEAIEATNRSYSTWNALYGDFNPCGLQGYSRDSIKLNHRRPAHGTFTMRY